MTAAVYSLRIKTQLPVPKLEAVLQACCIHPYKVALSDLEHTGGGFEKILRIDFASNLDRGRFSEKVNR
jgi:hypothetical protein